MKKKHAIVPPSKLAETSNLLEKKETIRSLEEKLESLKEEYNRETGIVIFNLKYEEALTNAANFLNLDRNKLDDAYHKSKGDLVRSFQKTARRPDFYSMISCGIGCSLITLASPLMVLANSEAWPVLFVSALTGTVSGLAIRDTVNDFKNRAKARLSIQDQVTQHQNRLPDLTAPKVD